MILEFVDCVTCKVDGLPSNTVAVINCCGQNVLDPFRRWNQGFKTAVYDSRVKTNQALARAISESPDPPSCFLHMSGVGYYPPGDAGFTETSAGGEHDWLATLVQDWEAAAQLDSSSPTRVVSLRSVSLVSAVTPVSLIIISRSGVVLGRRGGMIQQTLIPFLLGLGGRIGSGQQIMPWVHVKDVAGIMAHCVHNNQCSGVYNAVAPQLVTNSQFTQAYASALSRPAFIPLPGFIMQLIFGSERANMVLQSQAVIPQRTLESGYEFRFGDIKSAAEEFAHWDYIDHDEIPE